MKAATICILIATVFAAPCIYDVASTEPSPLNGLLAVTQAVGGPVSPGPISEQTPFAVGKIQ
nr:hypothetical protein [Rhizobium leguminosarum]